METIKTIKIAPDLEEIFVEGNVMRTDFAGGITYTADGLQKLTKEDFLKSYSYLTEEEYYNTRSIIGEIKGFVECEVGFYIIYGKCQKRYYPGYTDDGYCFKDRVAFENNDGVCYIPEGDFEDYFEDFTERYDSECGYTYEEIEERVKERFPNLATHIIEDYTKMVFDAVDWQYICTYLEEFDPEEED